MNNENIKNTINEIKAANQDKKPVIAVYGLLKAGKSFLLNMLTNHMEEEYFKTSSVRETIENKQFESDKYIYLDTPGLDADEQDTLHAEKGVRRADIVLFAHQPQGEFDAEEVTILRALKKSFGEHAAQYIVIVLTKIDTKSAENINLIEKRIKQQCLEALSFSPAVIQVSSKRYQTGVRKQQSRLIADSRMGELMTHLETIADLTVSVRFERMQKKVYDLLRVVEDAKEQLQTRQAKLHAEIAKGFAPFNDQMTQLRAFIDESVSNFKKI
jgi:GTPase Era involved in 16S rRNA processing